MEITKIIQPELIYFVKVHWSDRNNKKKLIAKKKKKQQITQNILI